MLFFLLGTGGFCFSILLVLLLLLSSLFNALDFFFHDVKVGQSRLLRWLFLSLLSVLGLG